MPPGYSGRRSITSGGTGNASGKADPLTIQGGKNESRTAAASCSSTGSTTGGQCPLHKQHHLPVGQVNLPAIEVEPGELALLSWLTACLVAGSSHPADSRVALFHPGWRPAQQRRQSNRGSVVIRERYVRPPAALLNQACCLQAYALPADGQPCTSTCMRRTARMAAISSARKAIQGFM